MKPMWKMQTATSDARKLNVLLLLLPTSVSLHTRDHWWHGPGPFWSTKVGPFMFSLVAQINKNLRDSKRCHVSTLLMSQHPPHSCPHITIHCEAQTGREHRQAEQKRNRSWILRGLENTAVHWFYRRKSSLLFLNEPGCAVWLLTCQSNPSTPPLKESWLSLHLNSPLKLWGKQPRPIERCTLTPSTKSTNVLEHPVLTSMNRSRLLEKRRVTGKDRERDGEKSRRVKNR